MSQDNDLYRIDDTVERQRNENINADLFRSSSSFGKCSLVAETRETTIKGRTVYEIANDDIWFISVDGKEIPWPYTPSLESAPVPSDLEPFEKVKLLLESEKFDQWCAERSTEIEEFKNGMSNGT